MNKKLAVGITGSFCNHAVVLEELEKMHTEGYEITYFITPNVKTINTRYGNAVDLITKLEKMSGRNVISSIVESELFVKEGRANQLIIMPCSATTCSKLVHGIYDNAVLMCAKSLLRNENPVTVAIATNDGLGISGSNIMRILSTKNMFVVPFGQDDYLTKPYSIVCDFRQCLSTLKLAYQKQQIQPVLLGAKGIHYE